jgi:hypothetical protein
MEKKHCKIFGDQVWVWNIESIWGHAKNLKVKKILIDSIAEFDQNCWFTRPKHPPTCRAVAEHAKRIIEADLMNPIILSADGVLMDGAHRIAKAWISGKDTIESVQLIHDLIPNYIMSLEEFNSR